MMEVLECLALSYRSLAYQGLPRPELHDLESRSGRITEL